MGFLSVYKGKLYILVRALEKVKYILLENRIWGNWIFTFHSLRCDKTEVEELGRQGPWPFLPGYHLYVHYRNQYIDIMYGGIDNKIKKKPLNWQIQPVLFITLIFPRLVNTISI